VDGADLSKADEYSLVDMRSGKPAKHPTKFRVGWDNDALVMEIVCYEPDMKNLLITDPVYDGDYVAVALETTLHSFYLLHIGPDGLVLDGNPSTGEWASLAQVETSKDDKSWTLKLRIPVVDAEEADADPNHRVAGLKPTAENPWFFMVGRSRLRGSERETTSFNKIEDKKGWRSLKSYGKLQVK